MTFAALLERARALAAEPARAPSMPLPWLKDVAETRGLGAVIDHTLLKPEATRAQIEALCDEGATYDVAAVCVNGSWVRACAERLRGTGVGVAAVVGFPLGASTTKVKASEARWAVEDGASEIDMVVALGQLKAGEWGYVSDDIRAVVEAAGTPVKVILETAALTPDEIAAATIVARDAGAAFVKTSTGFYPAGGAGAAAVALMRRAAGLAMGVKASGGIRTVAAVLEMLVAGANRIGTSSASAMASELGSSVPPIAELLAAAPVTERR